VFENRVLREIFLPKREEVAGGWRRQNNGELHNFYASGNIIRVRKIKEGEMGGECSTHGRHKKCIQHFGLKM
jgi:hypothetical protein